MSRDWEQVKQVLAEAAARNSPAERVAYLDGACRGDDGLRAEVEKLLLAHDQAGSFLEDPVAPPQHSNMVLPAPRTERPGDKIGHYKLLQQIGEGGCGVVYMAEQEEPIRRRVALKVIKLGMDTKQVIARFEAERQALALMNHPNIATVLDAGATDTGQPYFVMELARGIKITDYCDANNLSTEQRLDLFVHICHAIQHAHQKGIIHRDIKPSNILVMLADDVSVPKVIDFGIAKVIGERLTDQTVYTRFEQFIGTPLYTSPEQAGLSGLDVDTRSDIYSLGVLLYELLTGQTPFEPKALAQAGLEEIRRRIREQEPPKPSTRLSQLKPMEQTATAQRRATEAPRLIRSLRGDLDWIVMKALEKDRTRRYETANALAMDLRRHLENEPVVARPPSAAYRLQKACRRHKGAFVAAALIVVVLVAAVGISTWQAARATRAEKLASARLAESEAISKFLTEVFQSPDPAKDGRTITVAETLAAAAKKLERDLADQPARRAQLQATLARTYHALALYREAILLQEKVRDYYLAVYGLENPTTLETLHNLATSYVDGGRWDESLKLREQVLALRRKVLGPEHPDTLSAMNNLATSYGGPGHREEALKLREEVLRLRLKVSGAEHPDTLWAMSNLALSYDEAGRLEEALKLREEVLALRRKVLGPEHPATLNAMHYLAKSYAEAGLRDEALKLREEVLRSNRKVSGPEHADTLWAMQHLAASYEEAGREGEALKLREEVVVTRRKVLGPEHPNTLDAMGDLAWVLATSKAANVRNGTNAVRLAEEIVALTGRKNGSFLDTLAAAYAETGRFDKAVAAEQEAIALLESEQDKKDCDTRVKLYRANKPYRVQANP